jgi:TadE-like protein
LLLLLLMFLLACGRYFQTSSLLESAARDGARAATQSRSLRDAQTQVNDAVDRTMSQAVDSCKNTARGTIEGSFTPGSPISVEVECTINYRDLGLIGFNKDVNLRRKFTSTLDPFRGVR